MAFLWFSYGCLWSFFRGTVFEKASELLEIMGGSRQLWQIMKNYGKLWLFFEHLRAFFEILRASQVWHHENSFISAKNAEKECTHGKRL